MQHRITSALIACTAAISIASAGEAPRLMRVSNSGATALEPASTVRVPTGNTVTLGIEHERNAKYYEIQWYRNNEPLAGATAAELRISSTEASFGGVYHARLSTPCSQLLTSAATVELDQSSSDVVTKPLVVTDIELDDVFPNPVSDKATITFRLPKALKVTIHVTDLVGNNVATLVNATLPAGAHTVEYVVQNTTTSSSMYNVVLDAPGYSVVKPMLVVR